ncbi:type II secretion system protein N [Sphingorhabdus arenilitoris]|uniref:Type II secretion system protein N n=1 Tax=Sphingorhabdus arenilitoris TaxID=1490041 RepID=A0ABV8RHG7_9SPHN
MATTLMKAVEHWRQRLPRPNLFSFFLALLALFLIIQLARLFWTLATPVAPLGNWQAPVPPVMSASAREQIFGSFDPFFPNSNAVTSANNEGNEVITSLSITLFGIRSNEASGGGSAIIADPEGVQQSFAVGQEIMPGVTLHAVAFDHVVIRNNGTLEKLYLDQSVPAENVTPVAAAEQQPTPEAAIAKAPVALTADNLAKNVGLAPRSDGGKITGLVVSAKDDGSILRAAGLQSGDIITSVNGKPVTSPSDLASQFSPGSRLSVQIERGGQKIPVAIILDKP